MTEFFRFPHTPHLAWLGKGMPRDDKVLTLAERDEFLAQAVVIEEKIDGANVGVSFNEQGNLQVQNRGSYLTAPFGGQFRLLNQWIERYENALFDALGTSLILFGEWMAIRHSLDYTMLPDWLLGFDIYERNTHQFWSTLRRNELLRQIGLPVVPQIAHGGMTSLSSLTNRFATTQSVFRDGVSEGFYLRVENADWLRARAKLVQPEFVQQINSHWRNRMPEANQLAKGT